MSYALLGVGVALALAALFALRRAPGAPKGDNEREAILSLSRLAYDEIAAKLQEAGGGGAAQSDGRISLPGLVIERNSTMYTIPTGDSVVVDRGQGGVAWPIHLPIEESETRLVAAYVRRRRRAKSAHEKAALDASSDPSLPVWTGPRTT